MKNIIFLMTIILLLPVLSHAEPSISFDSEEHDFGAVAPVDTVEHVFEFTNTGDQDLLIQKLGSS